MFTARKILFTRQFSNNIKKLLMPSARFYSPSGQGSVLRDITMVDADTKISFPPSDEALPDDHEPRFLEQVQLFVDHAAAKTNVPADMLKYIMACDNVLRF